MHARHARRYGLEAIDWERRNKERCKIYAIDNATKTTIMDLQEKWLKKWRNPQAVASMLARPDVVVTNKKDKFQQLPLLEHLNEEVIKVLAQASEGAEGGDGDGDADAGGGGGEGGAGGAGGAAVATDLIDFEYHEQDGDAHEHGADEPDAAPTTTTTPRNKGGLFALCCGGGPAGVGGGKGREKSRAVGAGGLPSDIVQQKQMSVKGSTPMGGAADARSRLHELEMLNAQESEGGYADAAEG